MDHSRSYRQTVDMLLLCSFLFSLHDHALADPPYAVCSNNTGNSSFPNNLLNNLLFSLPSIASVSKYYNPTYGKGTDAFYVQYMCLNYVTHETCQDCMSGASQAIMNLCPDTTEAVVWEEVCQLRYSNIDFFGRLNVADNIAKDNLNNFSDPIHLQSIAENKLRNLTKVAAFNNSAKMYATGEEALRTNDTLYAMVQCTLDLSSKDCNKCLEAAIKDVSSQCYGSRGARLLSRSCYLRYELYAFYEHSNESSVSTNSQGRIGGMKICFNQEFL